MQGSYSKAYDVLKQIADSNKKTLPSKEKFLKSMKLLSNQLLVVSLFIFDMLEFYN